MTNEQLFLKYALLADASRLPLAPRVAAEVAIARATLAGAVRAYRAAEAGGEGTAPDPAAPAEGAPAEVRISEGAFSDIVSAVSGGAPVIASAAFAAGTADRGLWLETFAENFVI